MDETLGKRRARKLADGEIDIFDIVQIDYCIAKGEFVRQIILDLQAGRERSQSSNVAGYNFAHSEFWFWTLGAYEVSRRLKQRKVIHEQQLTNSNYPDFLSDLSALRMPFAKLAEAGTNRSDLYGLSVVSMPAGDMHFSVARRGQAPALSAARLISGFAAIYGPISQKFHADMRATPD